MNITTMPAYTATGIKDSNFTKQLAKIGNKIPDKISNFCELSSKGSMSRIAFLAIASLFLLGARYFQARNNDEKREVFTRDFSAVIGAVYALPVFEKIAGLIINKVSKVPIAYGEEGILKNLNPKEGKHIASFDQIKQWYVYNNPGYKDGFKGFLKNLGELGTDLNKGIKKLGNNSYESLNTLKNLTGIKEELSNKSILKIIDKANNIKNSENISGNFKDMVINSLNHLEKSFGEGNNLFKQASYQKSLTKASCIALTAGMLGWFLPWFNIRVTRDKYLNKPDTPDNNKKKIIFSSEEKDIFNNFINKNYLT